jgi:GAF domain-containing protein
MRDRMSPRTVLRRLRTHLPDTIEALKQVPQLFQTAVRDAAEGRFHIKVDSAGLRQLNHEQRRAGRRRDAAIVAAVLWLSGLLWLALSSQYRWFGPVQLGAAVILLLRMLLTAE